MSAWIRPGVKCVCVTTLTNWHPTFKLEVGQVYVIRDTAVSFSGDTSIAVDGMINDDDDGPYWHSSQFRPLTTSTQEQDVAKFRHLLAPSPVDAGLVPAGVEFDA